jgi:hypothetical protein
MGVSNSCTEIKTKITTFHILDYHSGALQESFRLEYDAVSLGSQGRKTTARIVRSYKPKRHNITSRKTCIFIYNSSLTYLQSDPSLSVRKGENCKMCCNKTKRRKVVKNAREHKGIVRIQTAHWMCATSLTCSVFTVLRS